MQLHAVRFGLDIPMFNKGKEDWNSYLERLDCYFAGKGVEDEKEVQTLIIGIRYRRI